MRFQSWVIVFGFRCSLSSSISSARKLLQSKLLPAEESGHKLVSIVDICSSGSRVDILCIPQACLYGKLKGKGMQYHGLQDKEDARTCYEMLVQEIHNAASNLIKSNSINVNSSGAELKEGVAGEEGCVESESTGGVCLPVIKHGTFGNRQVCIFNRTLLCSN